MAVAAVGDAVAATHESGSGPVPAHASVDIGVRCGSRRGTATGGGRPRAPVAAIVRRRPQVLQVAIGGRRRQVNLEIRSAAGRGSREAGDRLAHCPERLPSRSGGTSGSPAPLRFSNPMWYSRFCERALRQWVRLVGAVVPNDAASTEHLESF